MFFRYSSIILVISIVADVAIVGSQSPRPYGNHDKPYDKGRPLSTNYNEVQYKSRVTSIDDKIFVTPPEKVNEDSNIFSDYDFPVTDKNDLMYLGTNKPSMDYLDQVKEERKKEKTIITDQLVTSELYSSATSSASPRESSPTVDIHSLSSSKSKLETMTGKTKLSIDLMNSKHPYERTIARTMPPSRSWQKKDLDIEGLSSQTEQVNDHKSEPIVTQSESPLTLQQTDRFYRIDESQRELTSATSPQKRLNNVHSIQSNSPTILEEETLDLVKINSSDSQLYDQNITQSESPSPTLQSKIIGIANNYHSDAPLNKTNLAQSESSSALQQDRFESQTNSSAPDIIVTSSYPTLHQETEDIVNVSSNDNLSSKTTKSQTESRSNTITERTSASVANKQTTPSITFTDQIQSNSTQYETSEGELTSVSLKFHREQLNVSTESLNNSTDVVNITEISDPIMASLSYEDLRPTTSQYDKNKTFTEPVYDFSNKTDISEEGISYKPLYVTPEYGPNDDNNTWETRQIYRDHSEDLYMTESPQQSTNQGIQEVSESLNETSITQSTIELPPEYVTEVSSDPMDRFTYQTATPERRKKVSPQRVEYNDGDTGNIYWQCPPNDDLHSWSSNISYVWYKLSNGIKQITSIHQNIDPLTNMLEIKNPSPVDEGRYACMSNNTTLFVPSKILFYQFIILKTKWIDIGDTNNVSLYFNQKLILNCPHGDILRNGTLKFFQCSSRITIIERYPETSQDVYACSNSPKETIKLSATYSPDNCSLSRLGCPSNTEKDNVVNSGRCEAQSNDSTNPWNIKRCHEKVFIRFYYDPLKYRCFPYETDICSSDYYSFASLEQCEDNCFLIKRAIQPCFYPQNVDNAMMCSESHNGEYMTTYNIVSNECNWFFRRDHCQVSRNVFASIKQCRETCVQNKRLIEMDMKKACTSAVTSTMLSLYNMQRWVYVANIDDCVERNVSLTGEPFRMAFTTRIGCQKCKAANNKEICRTRPLNGECRKQEISWHFDYVTGNCIRILDGGCGESLNRFSSKVECQKVCAKYIIERGASSSKVYSSTPTIRSTVITGVTNTVREHQQLLTSSLRPTMITTEPKRPPLIPRSFDVSNRLLDKDPCYGNALIGTCDYGLNKQDHDLIRYTFVPEYSQCHRVRYSGCMGDENLFDDSNECKLACEFRLYRSLKFKRCQSPYSDNCVDQVTTTNSSQFTSYYYYSPSDKKCMPFKCVNTPKCVKQFFSSIDACHKLCRPTPPSEVILQNKCFGKLVIDNTSCQANDRTMLWFYMPSIEQCLQYSTCPVVLKGNTFATKSECEDNCLARNIFTVCSLPPDTGMGTQAIMKFYFDINKRKCRIFHYKGSMGNLNRFRSWEECFHTCVKSMLDMDLEPPSSASIESLPATNVEYRETSTNVTAFQVDTDRDYCYDSHKNGACSHIHPQIDVMKYFYNIYRRQCEPYLFSGCGAISRNSFDHMAICDHMCTARIQRPMSPLCLQKTNQCLNSSWIYWRYNSERGVCELFPSCTKSLPNGDTPFIDEVNCSQACVPPLPLKKDLFDICHLPPTINNKHECSTPSKRWFYDHEAGTCVSSLSCQSYGNNFPSLSTCLQWCLPIDPQDVCKLPMDSGPCMSNSSYYFFYDWESQSCKNFTYGGCLGNRNRFSSLKDCNTVCAVRRRCNIKTRNTDCRIQIRNNPPIYLYNILINRCEKINETVCGNFFEFYPSRGQCENECVITEEAKSIVFNVPNKMSKSANLQCKENLKFNNYPICLKTQDWLPRYYYDEYKDDCLFFYYNGCDGSKDRGNRFISLNHCRETCLHNQSKSTPMTTGTSQTSTINIRTKQPADRPGMCPRAHNTCQSLVSILKTCQTDLDCDFNFKCCGCNMDGSLTYQCMEPIGCMLSSYGCCADSEIVATDRLHSKCIKRIIKMIPFPSTKLLKVFHGEYNLECLMTGDPRPTINWIHLDSKRNVNIEARWDITRPMWSGLLHLNTNESVMEGLWVCRGVNEVGQDEIEVMVSSTSSKFKSTLQLYDDKRVNGTIRFVALGSNIVLHCPIYGVPRPSIKWLFNNSVVTDKADRIVIQGRFIYVNNVQHRDEGWWLCVAQQKSSVLTLMIKINVLEALRVLSSPHGNTIRATIGRKVTLYCNVIGKPQPNITWTWIKDGIAKQLTSLANIDRRIFVISSFSYESMGDYVCRANNDISEDSITFTVTSITNNDIEVEPAGFHFISDQITLHCPSKPGEKVLQVVWKKDNISMETRGLKLNFILHSKLDSGFYTCQHGGHTYQTHVYVHPRPVN